MKNYTYFFGGGKAEGKTEMKDLLGGKGANLAEMTNIGIPVPPGFTISTGACIQYYENDKNYPEGLEAQIEENMKKLEKVSGKKFGNVENPLLVSVRSGAVISMPGMMDTVLNLGLNQETIKGLIKKTRNERFARDCYRRFVQMFGHVVLGIDTSKFEKLIDEKKEEIGAELDTDLNAEDLNDLTYRFKQLIKDKRGMDFPEAPERQLKMAIDAVFESWNNKRAITYRNINDIPHDLGTAVNVQMMVFGNMGEDSGTGVAFTRNPSTGENKFYGEYLLNAQGEDVVSGVRTPHPIHDLKKQMPGIYDQLEEVRRKLEEHYKDTQDLEFTIENEKLYLLQTRTGKRTSKAAVNIAVDMVNEGLIDQRTAVTRVTSKQIDNLLHPMIDPEAEVESVAKGLPASPGAAVGKVVFDSDEAKERGEAGEKVVLVRLETSPDDIGGMDSSQGILTARGGMTCINGETKLLTTCGFLTAQEIYKKLEENKNVSILSYDALENEVTFRKIIASGRRKAKSAKLLVSQTGRSKHNFLKITPDHKFFTISNRKLIKKKLSRILKEKGFAMAVDRIPKLFNQKFSQLETDPDFAYLLGAISANGYVKTSNRRGSVTFTQKNTSEKEDFIEAVVQSYKNSFGYEMKYQRVRESVSFLDGRKIEGSVVDFIAHRKIPAEILERTQSNLVCWMLNLKQESLLNFLAGVIDGDGTFNKNRIQVYVKKKYLLEGITIACLRLGILPQVTMNRDSYNIQIVEKISEIMKYTKRVKVNTDQRYYGTKFYSIKSLFSDLKDSVSYNGRLKPMLKRNLLIDSDKLKNIYPECSAIVKNQLKKLLSFPLRMLRINKKSTLSCNWVYNFEVEEFNEINKNYIVFTDLYTPVLVSNSHAAVVGRGMGKPCVVGCSDLTIDEEEEKFAINGKVVNKNDYITLNGSTGELILGETELVEPKVTGKFEQLMEWADDIRELGVRTNADTPEDSIKALDFGAEGIGLCRTEHMFFAEERLPIVRQMILADDEQKREKALQKLMPMQKSDFIDIFKVMKGLPVTVRLLDPPLHEFLPSAEEDIKKVASDLGIEVKDLKSKIQSLHEFNPMLGHRGCRLGITFPEVYKMQVRAIFEATCDLKNEDMDVKPEVMIPLVGHINELKRTKSELVKVAQEVIEEKEVDLDYKVGTMIEIPRACLTADEVAKEADFFSFGTNDLTQMTFGFSRDDIAKFLPYYMENGVLESDPFMVLDQDGVGKLMQLATVKGREVKSNLKVGICGEHGGEPSSVAFCHKIGLDYVSCSPFRVPVARLSAAQIVVEEEFSKGKKVEV